MSFVLASKLPVSVLKNAESFNIKYDSKKHTYHKLVMTGNLNGMKWLRTNRPGIVCYGNLTNIAAEYGYLDIVKWLHEFCHTPGYCKLAMSSATGNGHLDVVKWLHENRTEGCTTHAMDSAARKAHLDTVNGYMKIARKVALQKQWIQLPEKHI